MAIVDKESIYHVMLNESEIDLLLIALQQPNPELPKEAWVTLHNIYSAVKEARLKQ